MLVPVFTVEYICTAFGERLKLQPGDVNEEK
jgi:hypothetical protein